jgi:hypothetical protein
MTALQPDIAACPHKALFERRPASPMGFGFHRVYERGEARLRGRFSCENQPATPDHFNGENRHG